MNLKLISKMKRLITLLSFAVIISASTFGQQFQETINVGAISGTDSTYFYSFQTEKNAWAMQFDFSGLDANDAIIEFGQSMDGINHTMFVNDSIPYTMDKTKRTVNMVYSTGGLGATYLSVKVTKGSVTAGNIILKGRNK